MSDDAQVTISHFAHLSGVSVHQPRHYDDADLGTSWAEGTKDPQGCVAQISGPFGC